MAVTCTDFTLTCIEKYSEISSMTTLLAMLFGGWVENFFGDSNIAADLSPLMVMIGGLNFLALVYGAVNVTYHSGQIMFNATVTGHVFGKMSPYTPLRIAIALGSLAPMIAASGSMVSVGQVSGMYIITLGSGSADLFWRAGVKRFLEVTSVDAIAASKSSSESLKMTETLVSMFMCTENMVKVASGNGNGIQKYAYAPVSPKGVAVYTQSSTLPDFNKVRSKFARIGSNVAATSLYAQVREEIADSSDPYYSHFSIKFVDGICGSIKIPLGLKASSGSTRSEKAAYYSSFHTAQAVMVYLKTLGDKTQAFNTQLRTKAGADIINAYQKPEVSRYAKYLDDTTKHKAYINDIFQASVNLSQCISNTVNNAYTGDLSRAPKGGSARCGTDTTGLSDVNPSNGSTGLLDALTEGGWIYAPQMFSTLNGLMQVASSNATIGIDMLAVPELPVREAFCPEVTSGWSQIKSYFTGSDDTDNLVDHHRACFPYFFASSTPKYVWNQMRKRGMEHELIPAWEDARTLTNWSTALSIASGSDGQASTTSSGVGGNEIIGTAANMLARAMGVGSFGGNMALNLASPTSDGIDYSNGPFDVSGATNALGMLAALGETLKVIWLFLLTAMTALDVIGKAFQAGLTGNLLAILGIPAIVAAKVLMPLVLAAVSGAFFLSNVLPILPMVAFAFIVVGFLVICAEALGGIALGSALLASASGDGLMSVHGLRMAALYGAIFLRPALHTIGLMLAFALCNITLAYFNGLWWGTMKNSIASDWDVFDLVMMVGGYPLLLCGLLVYCMKAVNLYANNIMSWIATEAIGQFGDADSYANESMNTIKSMGGAMNGALKGGGDKAGGRNNPTRKPGGNDNTDVKDERPPTASK